jgi:hypothetical protein
MPEGVAAGPPKRENEPRRLHEIGRIASSFGWIEVVVDVILRRLVGVDHRIAGVVFTGEPIDRQLRRIKGILPDVPDLREIHDWAPR